MGYLKYLKKYFKLQGYHLLYKKSWPYFRNAIMESGGPNYKGFPLISSAEATRRGKMLLSALGCNSSLSNSEILKCAQQLDPISILNATYIYLLTEIFYAGIYSSTSVTLFPFVIDNKTFTRTVEDSLAKKEFKKCKIITGFTSNEAGYFIATGGVLGSDPAYWDLIAKNYNSTMIYEFLTAYFFFFPNYPQRPDEKFFPNLINQYFSKDFQDPIFNGHYIDYLSKIGTDFLFTCPSFQMAEIYTHAKLESYVYSYNYRISTTNFPKSLGVVHTDELAVVFAEPLASKAPSIPASENNWSSAYHNYSNEEKKFTEDFLLYWTNFIKYNNPNYGLPKSYSPWKPFVNTLLNLDRFNSSTKERIGNYLVFNGSYIKTVNGFESHKCAFWNYTADGPYSNNYILINILIQVQ